jgi:glutaredoxin 3
MDHDVIIFGKRTCPYTAKAREIYERKGLSVEYIDVIEDELALGDMLTYSDGKRLVPVIVEGEKVSVGFGGT